MKLIYSAIIAFTVILTYSCNTNKNTSQKQVSDLPDEVLISFYNIENLFDTIDEPGKIDEAFLPDSDKKWNTEKYYDKLNKLAFVLSSYDSIKTADVIGLCELENKTVLEDLVKTEKLADNNLKIVHYESPDKRGIDNALVYNADYFKEISSEIITIDNFNGNELFTRDILKVKLSLLNTDNEFYIYVNHWPSRRGGMEKSEPRRLAVAQALRNDIDELLEKDANANIIIMGDFNDEPSNKSISEVLAANKMHDKFENKKLYNLSYPKFSKGIGTYHYWRDNEWNMLDQIIVSGNMLNNNSDLSIKDKDFNIYSNEKVLYQNDDGTKVPSKTYGRYYYGGYSDHLSPFVYLEIGH